MKVAVLFDNFGPYHWARLQAASGFCDLLAVEFGSRSGDYEWQSSRVASLRHAVVNSEGASGELSTRDFRARLNRILGDFEPQVVVVPGWASRGSLIAMAWAKWRRVPAVIMSESTQWDESRVIWKEMIKRRVVKLASAALVGGTPHADYIGELGVASNQVVLGYDVVDNDYFSREAEKWREQVPAVNCKKYFLSSNRFIGKKNLSRLLEAYAAYVKEAACQRTATPVWSLCMLGDGELKGALLQQCGELGLEAIMCAPWEAPLMDGLPHQNLVFFPGFRQIDELPRFYGQAGAFVHASSTEQWGLVVNEAMASGLPIIVSDRVGCACDLVEVGFNGFTFDYRDVNALSGIMTQVSSPGFPLADFGRASLSRISNWGPDRFGKGLKAAAEIALSLQKKRFGVLNRILLAFLIHRSSR